MIKVSIVEVGSTDAELFFGISEVGLKAEVNIWATWSDGQVVVMLSGNFGSSMTRTSDGERRPSIVPEAASSCLRISPRPSAFPAQRSVSLEFSPRGCIYLHERTTAQTEDLYVIARFWGR